MIRASARKYFVAIVYRSKIHIEKPALFLNPKTKTFSLKIIAPSSMTTAKFQLKEGRYTLLEWPPLTQAFLEEPCFLALDNTGTLRVHYIKDKKEEIIMEGGEKYGCACFAVDGDSIYAFNKKQELCIIDFKKNSIVSRRKIQGLDDPEKAASTHILQISPSILAVGSLIKSNTDASSEIIKPYLHIFCGDVLNIHSEITTMVVREILKIDPLSDTENLIFRFLYIQERQVLLIGHSKANRIYAFHFDFDGSINEIEGFSLGDVTLRGLVVGREPIPTKEKSTVKIRYQNKVFKVSRPLHIFAFDSSGDITHFYYCDTCLWSKAFSMFLFPVSIQQYYDLDQDQYLQGKLTAKVKKSRDRYRSQSPKKESGKVKRKLSVSLGARETTFSSEEKQKKILQLKMENRKKKILISPSQVKQAPPSSLFDVTNKPLFSIDRKTEDKLQNTTNQNFTGNSLFSAPTNNLFSRSITATNTSSSSLFGASNKTSSLFQKSTVKSTESEAGNGLFSVVVKKTTQPEKDSNLFTANAQSKSFLQVFQMPEDPMKKKAFLFLNKHESDVVFKVENEEFPAHKYILSEKCRFFKNAFASGMLESHSSVIEIKDTKASLFKAFLEYVYLGKTVMNEELALSLLDLSEKYMISDLKAACESCLQKVLTLDNCIKFFETACLYDAASLKKWTLFFFQMNIKKIMERKDFEDLPRMSYLNLMRIHWNQTMKNCPPLSQLLVE